MLYVVSKCLHSPSVGAVQCLTPTRLHPPSSSSSWCLWCRPCYDDITRKIALWHIHLHCNSHPLAVYPTARSKWKFNAQIECVKDFQYLCGMRLIPTATIRITTQGYYKCARWTQRNDCIRPTQTNSQPEKVSRGNISDFGVYFWFHSIYICTYRGKRV